MSCSSHSRSSCLQTLWGTVPEFKFAFQKSTILSITAKPGTTKDNTLKFILAIFVTVKYLFLRVFLVLFSVAQILPWLVLLWGIVYMYRRLHNMMEITLKRTLDLNRGYSVQQRRTPNTVSHMTLMQGGHAYSLGCVWTALSWQSWPSQAWLNSHWNRRHYPNTCLWLSTLWLRSHDLSEVQN